LIEVYVATPTQTFDTHRYSPVAWNMAWLVAVLVLVLTFWDVVRAPSLRSITLLLLAIVVVMTVSLLRVFALRLQNRIIRLEMQVRLARLGREDAMRRLELSQIIALRFASDAELPALIDRVLAEKLPPDGIKRAVTDWQGDYLRT
jgi:hypothetical protein